MLDWVLWSNKGGKSSALQLVEKNSPLAGNNVSDCLLHYYESYGIIQVSQ